MQQYMAGSFPHSLQKVQHTPSTAVVFSRTSSLSAVYACIHTEDTYAYTYTEDRRGVGLKF